ncbi:hypothetical protein HPB47_014689 [Ixodes persulcatus]|uniref:Uncharacterized protein n=1 Tax=Ixodes persulcatus TaxID=34615 RepID=A0AC60QXT5_IXOPE|nr:hypothetical protein HPB47_014689 [Ixodes persulcatus]
MCYSRPALSSDCGDAFAPLTPLLDDQDHLRSPDSHQGLPSVTRCTLIPPTRTSPSLGFAPLGIATDLPPGLPARKAQAPTMPNSADNAMEFDAQSGRTLAPPGPWQQILRERRNLKNPPAKPARPQSHVNLQTVHLARQHPDYPTPTTRSSFGHELDNDALALSEISTIQLGAATYEVQPYLKPLPGTRRGVTHGLDPGTTTDKLPHILAYNGARILHARMLGNSTSAVVTFEGIHVPFYIKAYGLFTRCRPYRQTVQCCSLCGELGHRQDVCPNPDTTMCAQCHTRDPTPDHDCTPKCQLCGLAHPTASKDCRKKLRPSPPPLRVRERALTSQRWQQQPSPNSQPPEQRQFPPNQPNQRQGSWSTIVARLLLMTDSRYSPPVPPKLPTPASKPFNKKTRSSNSSYKLRINVQLPSNNVSSNFSCKWSCYSSTKFNVLKTRPRRKTPMPHHPSHKWRCQPKTKFSALKARPLIGTPRPHHLPLAPLRPFRQVFATLSALSTR